MTNNEFSAELCLRLEAWTDSSPEAARLLARSLLGGVHVLADRVLEGPAVETKPTPGTRMGFDQLGLLTALCGENADGSKCFHVNYDNNVVDGRRTLFEFATPIDAAALATLEARPSPGSEEIPK